LFLWSKKLIKLWSFFLDLDNIWTFNIIFEMILTDTEIFIVFMVKKSSFNHCIFSLTSVADDPIKLFFFFSLVLS